MMLIEWYGHSCFKITSRDYSIALDPYNPNMINGLGNYHIEADAVYCSHEHGDHNYKPAVTLSGKPDKGVFKINFIETFHDEESGQKRGRNKITMLESDGIKVAHMGDLGCDLSKSQINTLKNLDALMIPIGGYYTIDAHKAKAICDVLKPRVIIPMHYRGDGFGPAVIATKESFTELYQKTYIVKYDSNIIEVNSSTINQVAILKYR